MSASKALKAHYIMHNILVQVLMSGYNATEGWAPSTYMEKLPARYRTLDRP